MIYIKTNTPDFIKTNMTEYPKCCKYCQIRIVNHCGVTGREIHAFTYNFKQHRPKDCPLVEIKENENDQTKTN